MLYELLVKYEQIILYEEVKNASGKIIYENATIYTNVEFNDKDGYITLSNDDNNLLKFIADVEFNVTPLKFRRDKIELFIENKKIKLFANYLDEVLINQGVV